MRQGREVLDRELSRLNVREVPTDAIAKQLKFTDTEALCVALGAGDLAAAFDSQAASVRLWLDAGVAFTIATTGVNLVMVAVGVFFEKQQSSNHN